MMNEKRYGTWLLYNVLLFVSLIVFSVVRTEAGTTKVYSTPLTLGAGYQDTVITSDAATYYFPVTVPKGGKLKVSVMSYGGSVFSRLVNSERTHFYYNGKSSDYDFQTSGTNASPGTNATTYYVNTGSYYVQCTTYGSGNRYKLKADLTSYDLADKAFDSYDSPTSIVLNTTYTGIISNIYQNRSTARYTYDDDWYRLDLEKAGTYSFTLGAVDNTYMDYELYKGDDLNHAYLKQSMSQGMNTAPVTYKKSIFLQPGTYYLKACYTIRPLLYRFSVSQVVPAPTSLSAALSKYNAVKLSWDSESNITAYEVYYRTGNSGTYTLYTRTSSNMCTFNNLSAGKNYSFKVRAYASQKAGISYGPESTVSINTLKKANAPKVSKRSSSKVKVKWKKVSGASGYQLSISKKKSGITVKYKGSATSKKLKVKRKTKLYYKVRAYALNGKKKVYAPWSKVVSFKLR